MISFPTKQHWRDQADLDAIGAGLEALARLVPSCNIKTLAVPALGCGLGGLAWDVVRPLMVEKLQPAADNARVLIYQPA